VWFPENSVAALLSSIKWSTTTLIAHHAQFDGLILSHHYNIHPAVYCCTMSMARPLHGNAVSNSLDELSKHYGGPGKLHDLSEFMGVRDLNPAQMKRMGLYCCHDVNETWRIYQKMLVGFPEKELRLIHHTIEAYARPVLRINKRKVLALHKQEQQRKAEIINKVGLPLVELRSNDRFAQHLQDLGVNPPTKISATTNKETYAFAKSDLIFQELLDYPDKRVAELVEARLAVKSSIEETRAWRLYSHSMPAFPVYLNYGAAHTLRWTGGDKCNPQNFGRKSPLRNCIEAPPGYRLVICDSGQIEARKNAWFCDENDLVDAFRSGRDLYSEFAQEEIFHRSINGKDNPDERFVGKVSILALGYMMGAAKFQYTLEAGIMGKTVVLPSEMYNAIVQAYRNKYARIAKMWTRLNGMLAIMSTTRTQKIKCVEFRYREVALPNGLSLHYPNLRYDGTQEQWLYNAETKIYGALLLENIIQALARCVVAEQNLRCAERYRMVLQVHDEGVFLVKWREAKKAEKWILEQYHQPPDWCPDLPVVGESKIRQFYEK
jgi:hypothetical protein